jgi:hypothetical protein
MQWFQTNTPRLAKAAALTREIPPITEVMGRNGWV